MELIRKIVDAFPKTWENNTMSSSPPPQSDQAPSLDSQSIVDRFQTLSIDPGPITSNGAESRELEDEKMKDEEEEKSRYPVREGVEDCSFYMRNGTCKFGMNCKFNHPVRGRTGAGGGGEVVNGRKKDEQSEISRKSYGLNLYDSQADKVKEKDEYPERTGMVNCKYYDRPGGCKYGKACRFNHNRKTSAVPPVELNFMGLPLRPEEKECPYYARNGSCKYGANCRLHHPEPIAVGGSASTNGGSITSRSALQTTFPTWSLPTDSKDSYAYVPFMFPPTQGVPSNPKWSSYTAPVYAPQTSPFAYPPQGANYLGEANIYTQQQPQIINEFPERPGQPECDYFLRTGNCKYRSACKFHHPKSVIANHTSCVRSVLGLPLRPGQNICSHYSRYGICKFGPECKYDHPENYGTGVPSTVGLNQPLPVGIPTNGS